MSDTDIIGLPEAARRLGVTTRTLRGAIRAGRLAAPPLLAATAPISAEWLHGAMAAVEASPKILTAVFRQKVAPFARYQGTSAWRKYPNRVRAHARQAQAERMAAK